MTNTEYNKVILSNSDRLLRYALKLTNDFGWSEDLVQESLIKLWKNKDKVTLAYAKPFLYRVLYNKMIDDKRKQSRISLSQSIPELSENGSQLETTDLITKAFDRLSIAQKQIIMLRDWDGYSYQEISQILEISLSLVKVQLFRARKKMKMTIESLTSDISCYNGYN